MKKRILAILIALLSLFMLLPAASAERTTLFIGDTPWRDDALAPFIEAEGKALLPASAFEALGGIRIEYSEVLGSLLLYNNEKYLSFNLQSGKVLDNSGIKREAKIYRYGGELYLEPKLVCSHFGIGFELAFGPDGYLSARLTDGSELLSLEELLATHTEKNSSIPYLYNPAGKTVAGIFMYPMIIEPTSTNITSIVSLLGSESVTIVLSPEKIADYSQFIPLIYASGHSVAYYMDKEDASDTAAFMEAMAAANDYLFALVGKTVRIYVSREKYDNIPKLEGYFKKSCTLQLSAGDLLNERAINNTLLDSPASGIFNFGIASDRNAHLAYRKFFNRFNSFEHLRSMNISEASPSF